MGPRGSLAKTYVVCLSFSLACLWTGLLSSRAGADSDLSYSDGIDTRVRETTLGKAFTSQNPRRCIAVRGDTVYVVFSDTREGADHSHVFCTASLDRGLSFGKDICVDHSSNAGGCALDVGPDQQVYVAWQDARRASYPYHDIYFSRGVGLPPAFASDLRVDDTGETLVEKANPAIGCSSDGEKVYVVWEDDRGPWWPGLYMSQSVDGGTSFSANRPVPDSLAPGSECMKGRPSVSVMADGTVGVGFYAEDLYYMGPAVSRGYDEGSTFPGVTTAWPYDEERRGGYPALAALDSRLYAVWSENGSTILYCAQLQHAASEFESPVRVDDGSGAAKTYPAIAVTPQGMVYVAWVEGAEVRFAASADGGMSFGAPITINDVGGVVVHCPHLAVDTSGSSLDAYLVWTDYRGGYPDYPDVYFDRVSIEVSTAIAAGDPVEPAEAAGFFATIRPLPNPVRQGGCRFRCTSPAGISGEAKLMIHDTKGRLCRIQSAGSRGSGLLSIDWDGRDDAGHPLPPGIYYCTIQSEQVTATAKLAIIR